MGPRLAALLVLLLALLVSGTTVPGRTSPAVEAVQPPPAEVAVYVFWSRTCPHCARALAFLDRLEGEQPGVGVVTVEVEESEANRGLFAALSAELGIEPAAVPLIVIGQEASVGYDDATTGRELAERARACLARACPDLLAARLQAVGAATGRERAPAHADDRSAAAAGPGLRRELPATVRLPLLGEVDLQRLSLPILTVTLAAVDGFNPCAMWVLVFLIGLLLGVRDRVRMWLLGGAFLAASAVVYFLIMTAWLNLLLLLGAVAYVRLAVGAVAVGAGLHYLRTYANNPGLACEVTAPERRRRVLDRLRQLALEPRLGLALLGVVALAGAVNLVEFLCSAGVPAVYTGLLAQSGLAPWAHHLYLLLYLAVFMLDDVAVFVAAMASLHATGLTGRYAHHAHLIGGLVLVALGIILVLRPELLALA